MNDPAKNITNVLSTKRKARITKNRQILTSIIKCIELCGRQGLALRGHRDDSTSVDLIQGNFNALLNLRVDSGDVVLKEHLETAAKNAIYISKTAQNEILYCMKTHIQDQITQQVKTSIFYGMEADEVKDSSNWEQLGLVLRYTQNGAPVKRIIEYIQCENCTGKEICKNIIQTLEKIGIDPKLCRAQTYDGAGNMAGSQNGCSKEFQKVSPRAPYYHCASHELNLALSHSCKIQLIQNMVCWTVFQIFAKSKQKIDMVVILITKYPNLEMIRAVAMSHQLMKILAFVKKLPVIHTAVMHLISTA